MYKKFKLELASINTSYMEDKTLVTANFKMLDPSQNFGTEEDPNFRSYGAYNVDLDFPAGSDPTREEICDEVQAQPGVVQQY